MELKKSTLYGVGVGPGDPELMTRKACSVLEQCDVVASPRTWNGHMTALEIASGAVDLSQKEILPLPFAMQREESVRRKCYEESLRQLTDRLSEGKSVALLTLGDLSVFSSFHYLAQPVREAGYAVELIPGVTSFSAVAAKLGISLTEMDQPLHIVPSGSTNLEAELDLPGTKVLMKAGKSIPDTIEVLKRKGLLEKTRMVADCGMPSEQVICDLSELKEAPGYFTTLVVKE